MLKEWIGGMLGQRTGGELDALVKAYTELGKFSGSVLVGRGDEILLSKGYGLANREHNIPNTPQTVFRIGSMTKPFTAIAVMQLVESGRLSVQDTLSKYLPDFPNGERIRLHHLLSNTSGIADYVVMPAYEKIMTQRTTLADIIALFRDEPLIFEPGADFGYSNSNWALLGYIIEQVTGKAYADVIRERIFDPAGMTHSGYDWEQPIIPLRAMGYVDTGEQVLNAEVVHETTMHAAGALYSTAEDLYRWDRALAGSKLLRRETMQQMFTPVWKQYAYGWELHTIDDRRCIAHSGGLPGWVCNIARFVDDDVVVIVLSNLGSAAYGEISDALAAVVFGAAYQLPSKYTFVEVNPAVFADYVGEYELTYFGRKSVLRFSVEGERMVMNVHGLPKSVLSALSETSFFARSKGEVVLNFVRDASGEVNTIDVNWAGFALKASRLN